MERYHHLENLPTLIIQIRRVCLPFYLEAAKSTRFQVNEIAREGEKIGRKIYPSGFYAEVMRGFVGISITKPKEQKDHESFWTTLNSNPSYTRAMTQNFTPKLKR